MCKRVVSVSKWALLAALLFIAPRAGASDSPAGAAKQRGDEPALALDDRLILGSFAEDDEIERLRAKYRELRNRMETVVPGGPALEHLEQHAADVEREILARQKELLAARRTLLQSENLSDIRRRIEEVELEKNVAERTRRIVAENVERMKRDVPEPEPEEAGEVELLRGEIDQLETTLGAVTQELEQMQVELSVPPRVVVLEKASADDVTYTRPLGLSVAVGAGTGVLVFGAVFVWRRKWILPLLLGVFSAAGATAAIYLAAPIQGPGEVTAAIRLAQQPPVVLFERPPDRDVDSQFENFKRTQTALLRSKFVLNPALRKPEVRNLPLVKEQTEPVDWLSKALRIEFPEDAEVMHVTLAGNDPAGQAAIVNAVTEAYMNEVVGTERQRDKERVVRLGEIRVDLRRRVGEKRNALSKLTRRSGWIRRESEDLQRQLALDRLRYYSTWLSELDRALIEHEARLELLRAKEQHLLSEQAARLPRPKEAGAVGQSVP